ncbi:ABC transporter permease [Chitinophaga defluvii]|uniref:ABC transporter permease n=1 Tax=Chitinophaga defluvii TaxID=3163343 RepID=A0ABV2T7D8_9BACT
MIKNYLLIAWRNLLKQKLFAAINIVGMAVAFCAALLLLLTAYREWSFDKMLPNRKQVHQLYFEEHWPGRTEENVSMPAPIAPALQQECPGVQYVTRYVGGNNLVQYKDQEYQYLMKYVDADFLRVFPYPLLKGSGADALRQTDQVVITEKIANNIFKGEDPIGKTIKIKQGDNWMPVAVAAIAKDIPDNSSIEFDLLLRFETQRDYAATKDSWGQSSYNVFVQLNPHTTATAFEQQSKTLVNKYYADKIRDLKRDGAVPDASGGLVLLKTIPLEDIRFNRITPLSDGASKFYPWLMVGLGLMITLVSSINFINLSIARSFTRSAEIGLRKALGAMRNQLIIQFWSEAFIVCGIALIFGVILAYFLIPSFNTLFSNNVSLGILKNVRLIVVLFLGFLGITLVAGGYPAWLVARFNIVQVLKGKINMGSQSNIRNGLIIVQFAVAILLISCTAIAWQQLNYMHTRSLGFDKQQVISIPVDSKTDGWKSLNLLRNRLASTPDVLSITASELNLGSGRDGHLGTSRVGFDYKGRAVKTHWLSVDYDYTKTLGLTLLGGRDFSRTYGNDSNAVVINEKMVAQLGEKEPIGIYLDLGDGEKVQIIGVIKDYNFESLHKNIEPLTINMQSKENGGYPHYIFVRVLPKNLAGAMHTVEKIWQEINPQSAFEGSFLDENADRQYRREARFSKIFVSGAILAIIISCMGLFAVTLLVLTQKRKEIGIRKVLGASVNGIVMLIAKDFIKLVAIAIFIAAPLAWFAMHQWLKGFAYRIDIQWWLFAITGLLAMLIAFVTISFQSVKAALANPVKSLHAE